MRRFFALFLFLCLLVPLLTGCGGEAEEIILTTLDAADTPPLSRSDRSVQITTPFGPAVTAALPSPPLPEDPPAETAKDPDTCEEHYVLNTSSKRFHLPSCSSVDEMKPANREDFTGPREELIARGYKPCGRCNP